MIIWGYSAGLIISKVLTGSINFSSSIYLGGSIIITSESPLIGVISIISTS